MSTYNILQPESIGSILGKILTERGLTEDHKENAPPQGRQNVHDSPGEEKRSPNTPSNKSQSKNGNHLLLLSCIEAIEVKYHKLYCLATRRTLQRLLSTYHGINVSLRTISRYIKRLKEEGYLDLVYRKKRTHDGKVRQRATLFKVIRKGWTYLKGMTITIARRYGITRLTKKSTNQLFSYEKDHNNHFTAEKIDKIVKTYNLKEGLPTTPETFFSFIKSL